MLSVGYIELTEQHSLVKFLVAIKTLLEIDCIYCISYYFWADKTFVWDFRFSRISIFNITQIWANKSAPIPPEMKTEA